MRLLLIRHGQTPSNVAGALDTAFPGAGLTDLGGRQAAAIPTALGAEPITGVYASPLVRTQLTASPLARARGLDMVVQDGLREISAGSLEMRTDHDAVEEYHHALRSWMEGDLDVRLGGQESGREFMSRYDEAIGAIARAHGPDDTVVAVSHGAAIRLWVTLRAAGVDRAAAPEMRLSNTAAAYLAGASPSWRLLRWHPGPLGGDHLVDLAAHDVTGDPEDEALGESAE